MKPGEVYMSPKHGAVYIKSCVGIRGSGRNLFTYSLQRVRDDGTLDEVVLKVDAYDNSWPHVRDAEVTHEITVAMPTRSPEHGIVAVFDRTCSLKDAAPGLFLYDGCLCMKTEYGDNDGGIDAFIVSTGERFWGGQTNKHLVAGLFVSPLCISLGDETSDRNDI